MDPAERWIDGPFIQMFLDSANAVPTDLHVPTFHRIQMNSSCKDCMSIKGALEVFNHGIGGFHINGLIGSLFISSGLSLDGCKHWILVTIILRRRQFTLFLINKTGLLVITVKKSLPLARSECAGLVRGVEEVLVPDFYVASESEFIWIPPKVTPSPSQVAAKNGKTNSILKC